MHPNFPRPLDRLCHQDTYMKKSKGKVDDLEGKNKIVKEWEAKFLIKALPVNGNMLHFYINMNKPPF